MKPVDDVSGRPTGWQILEIVARAQAIPREFDATMFGRQSELSQLRSAFRRTVRSGIRAAAHGDG